MKRQEDLEIMLQNGGLDIRLKEICGGSREQLLFRRERLLSLIHTFASIYGNGRSLGLYSAPGRTEMGGNHTDHQHGRVLAAAIDLDMVSCAAKNDSSVIRVTSDGYPEIRVDLSNLNPVKKESGTTAALIRGIASRLSEMGYSVSGFDACVTSQVLGGSGLSSSAAFEVLMGVIMNDLFCGGELTAVQIAQIGQYSENVFFEKPCGLMDQLASSVGGITAIDFNDPETPEVEKLECSLEDYGYALCIIDSGADHADLTDEYASIPGEMGQVAAFFGKKVLRQVAFEEFWSQIPALREKAGDRAVLRALHFYSDNDLVVQQKALLQAGNFEGFLSLVNQSGHSSAECLQNIFCCSTPDAQAVSLTIAAARRILKGRGAVRVHGGGFAGTVQAYVPLDQREEFRGKMEAILGEGRCHFLNIRPGGGTVIA